MLSWLKAAGKSAYFGWRRFIEFAGGWRYYGNKKYRDADMALWVNYMWSNPYQISRRFSEHLGEKEIYTYGETPVATLAIIAQRCGLNAEDTVLELGCGRGKACFWLRTVLGCKEVVGVDYNPYFAEIATRIANRFEIDGVEFRCQDMLHTDLSEATVVYLYGSALDDETIERLAARLSKLPEGTKIITVSYGFHEYVHSPVFSLVDSFDARFTWGTATVYYSVIKKR